MTDFLWDVCVCSFVCLDCNTGTASTVLCVFSVKSHLCWCVYSDMPGMKVPPVLGQVGRPSTTMVRKHMGQVAVAWSPLSFWYT